jgi:hypothetical protein
VSGKIAPDFGADIKGVITVLKSVPHQPGGKNKKEAKKQDFRAGGF